MNDTTRPEDQRIDEVEGHAIKARGLLGDEPDDVEGHISRGRGFSSDELDDVEGHAYKSGRALPGDEDAGGDDVEGHLARGRGA